MTEDELLRWIEAETRRLTERPPATAGVPMILAVEAGDPPPGQDPVGRDFLRALALLERERGALDSREVAEIVEALAEREIAG